MTCSYQQNTRVSFPLSLCQRGMFMLQTALPRVSPGVLLCSNLCCVHRIVYEAKINPLCLSLWFHTEQMGWAHRPDCYVLFTESCAWDTVVTGKTHGHFGPCCPTQINTFQQAFLWRKPLLRIALPSQNQHTEHKNTGQECFAEKWRDVHVNIIFSPNQIHWASYIMPSELFLWI